MKALLQLDQWPVERATAGWIDGLGHSVRHGPTDQAFGLASVTKPLFAYAVLIAIEEGTLSLDQAAGPPGATVRHLLAHASGLGDDPRLPLAGVGRRRIYSNAGFELLGDVLASAAGISVATYVHEAVVEPLGLVATELRGSAAHGAQSSVDDLLLLLAEWLDPTLVAPETLTTATLAHFETLPGVLPGYGRQDPNSWGLGFELKGTKTPHWTGATNSPSTFGHFGRSGTFVWVDPVTRIGCVALTNRDFGPWAVGAWPALADAVVDEAGAANRG